MLGGVGRQPSKISLRKTGDTKSSEGASKSESQDKVAHFKLTDLNNTGSANGKFGQGKYQVEPDKVAQSFKNVATVLESFKGNEEQIGEKTKEIEGLQGEIAKLGEQGDKGGIDELNSRIKNLNAEITTLNAQSADDSVDVGLQTFSKEELSALKNPEKADGAAMRKIMLKLSKACEIELMTFKETKMPNDKLENLLVAYESVAMQTEGLDDLFKDVKQQSRLKTYSDGSSKIKDPKQGKHNKAHVGTAKAMLHWYCETVQKNSFDAIIGDSMATLNKAKQSYNTKKPLKSIMDKLEKKGIEDGKVDHKNIKLFFEKRIELITNKKVDEFQRKLTTDPDFTDPPKAVEDGTKAESKSWFQSISSMMPNISNMQKSIQPKTADAILARDLKQLETAQMVKDDQGQLQVVDSDGNPIKFEDAGLFWEAGGTIDGKLEGLESILSDGSGLVFSNETFEVSTTDLDSRTFQVGEEKDQSIEAKIGELETNLSNKTRSSIGLRFDSKLTGLKKEVQLKKDISALKDPVLKADKQLELRQTQLENFKRELTEQKKTEKDTTNLKDIKEKLQNIESDISKIKLETKCRTAVKKGIDQVKTKQQKSKLDGLKSEIKTLAETAKKDSQAIDVGKTKNEMIALIKSNDVGKLKTLDDGLKEDITKVLKENNERISGSRTDSVLRADKKRKNDTILKAIDKFEALKDLKETNPSSELDKMGLDTEIDLLEQTILKDFMEVNLELLKLNHEKVGPNEKAGIEENILKDEKALADINSGIAALTAKAKAIKTTKKELKKIESSKNKSELTHIKKQLKQDKTNGNHANYNMLKSNLSKLKSEDIYTTEEHKDSIDSKINDLNEQITRLQTESQEATTATATDGEGTQAKSTYGMGSITKLFKSSNESKITKLEAQKTKLENEKKLLDGVEKMTDPEAKVDSQLDLMESFFKEGIDNAKKEITQLETQEKNPDVQSNIQDIKLNLIKTRTALDQLEQKLDVVQTEKEVRANIRAAAGDEVSQLKTTLGEVKTSSANAKELLQELALGESVEGGMGLVDKEIATLKQKVADLGQQKYTSKDMERIMDLNFSRTLLEKSVTTMKDENKEMRFYGPKKSANNDMIKKFEKQIKLIDKYLKAEAKAEAKIKDDIVKRLYLKMGKVPSEQANTIREKIELVKDKETDKTKLLSLLALEKATASPEELDEIRNEESRIKGETDEMLDTKLEFFELQLTDFVKYEKSLNKEDVKEGTLTKGMGERNFKNLKHDLELVKTQIGIRKEIKELNRLKTLTTTSAALRQQGAIDVSALSGPVGTKRGTYSLSDSGQIKKETSMFNFSQIGTRITRSTWSSSIETKERKLVKQETKTLSKSVTQEDMTSKLTKLRDGAKALGIKPGDTVGKMQSEFDKDTSNKEIKDKLEFLKNVSTQVVSSVPANKMKQGTDGLNFENLMQTLELVNVELLENEIKTEFAVTPDKLSDQLEKFSNFLGNDTNTSMLIEGEGLSPAQIKQNDIFKKLNSSLTAMGFGESENPTIGEFKEAVEFLKKFSSVNDNKDANAQDFLDLLDSDSKETELQATTLEEATISVDKRKFLVRKRAREKIGTFFKDKDNYQFKELQEAVDYQNKLELAENETSNISMAKNYSYMFSNESIFKDGQSPLTLKEDSDIQGPAQKTAAEAFNRLSTLYKGADEKTQDYFNSIDNLEELSSFITKLEVYEQIPERFKKGLSFDTDTTIVSLNETKQLCDMFEKLEDNPKAIMGFYNGALQNDKLQEGTKENFKTSAYSKLTDFCKDTDAATLLESLKIQANPDTYITVSGPVADEDGSIEYLFQQQVKEKINQDFKDTALTLSEVQLKDCTMDQLATAMTVKEELKETADLQTIFQYIQQDESGAGKAINTYVDKFLDDQLRSLPDDDNQALLNLCVGDNKLAKPEECVVNGDDITPKGVAFQKVKDKAKEKVSQSLQQQYDQDFSTTNLDGLQTYVSLSAKLSSTGTPEEKLNCLNDEGDLTENFSKGLTKETQKDIAKNMILKELNDQIDPFELALHNEAGGSVSKQDLIQSFDANKELKEIIDKESLAQDDLQKLVDCLNENQTDKVLTAVETKIKDSLGYLAGDLVIDGGNDERLRGNVTQLKARLTLKEMLTADSVPTQQQITELETSLGDLDDELVNASFQNLKIKHSQDTTIDKLSQLEGLKGVISSVDDNTVVMQSLDENIQSQKEAINTELGNLFKLDNSSSIDQFERALDLKAQFEREHDQANLLVKDYLDFSADKPQLKDKFLGKANELLGDVYQASNIDQAKEINEMKTKLEGGSFPTPKDLFKKATADEKLDFFNRLNTFINEMNVDITQLDAANINNLLTESQLLKDLFDIEDKITQLQTNLDTIQQQQQPNPSASGSGTTTPVGGSTSTKAQEGGNVGGASDGSGTTTPNATSSEEGSVGDGSGK